MNPVLSLLETSEIYTILGHPASSVYVPREVFQEYHLKAFDCAIIGEFLEITRFVVQDKGNGHGSRLLADLDEWAKQRRLPYLSHAAAIRTQHGEGFPQADCILPEKRVRIHTR